MLPERSMIVAIVSADQARRAWLGDVVRRVAGRVALAADEDAIAAPVSLMILDLVPDRLDAPGDDPGTPAAAGARCRRWRASSGGDRGTLLLVGANPDLPPTALSVLLDAGADDYLALPDTSAASERALERVVLTIARRQGRDEAPLDAGEAGPRPLVEQLPCCVYVQARRAPDEPEDAPFRFLFVSPQIEAMLGYTAEEWMEAPGLPESRIHPEDAARLVAADVASDREDGPFLAEYRMIARDGRIVWARDEAVLVRDAAGRPRFWQGVVVDVTDRKLAEQRLAAAEVRYRTLIEQMPAMTYLAKADEHGTPVFVSPQVESITGESPEFWMANPEFWAERIHPDDVERVYAAHRRCNETGEPFHAEYRLRHRDGHDVWIGEEARPVLGEDGETLWQGVWVDTSRRKEAEAALRESERRYRDLVEQSEGLIASHDLDGVIRSVNSAAARSLDYAPRDLIGTNLRDYLSPQDRETFARYLERVRREPVVSGQVSLRTRAGDERIWSYRNVRSAEPGRPVQVIAHAHDVTDRHRAEAALRTSEARLRQVLASEQRKTRELDLIGQVHQALAKELDLETVIRTVVEGLRDTFGYGLVSLYLIEHDRLRLRHQVGYPRIIEEIPLDRGAAGRVARTGRAALIPDGLQDPDFLRAFDEVASEVCVPLRVGDQVVGVLSLESTDTGGLDEDDLRLMLALAEVVGVAVDRARLYAALRGSEERFRTAFDVAPIGMVLLDPVLRTLRVNAAFGRMIGLDIAGGIVFADLVHPDDRAVLREALERLVAGETPVVELETRYLDRSNREMWGQTSASLVRDDAGEPLYAILQIQDVTERKALAEKLRHLALHDPLTGLANRALFLDRLAMALGVPAESVKIEALAGRAGPLVAVLYLDLDGFKAVNDRFGHEAGDELLAIVARRLLGSVRPGDIVARFGGDEFTVLLTDLDGVDEARAVADRLLSAVRQPVVLANGRHPMIGACAGIAVGESGAVAPGDLLRNADAALYRAKAGGPNAIALFDALLDGVARVAS
jgi:diguanylate cyclase (GGDEF)-like protein/PAS domain S-box-containing protein